MVTALYVREDSVYKSLGLDCYDINRDARLFPGGNPVIAHPPCRMWGRLSQFAKGRPDERQLAVSAVSAVRSNGGVLEHPYGSALWKEVPLPSPGTRDVFGGYTILINQSWFGHKAQKKTLLYIVGCKPSELPPIPISFDIVEYVVRPAKKFRKAKIITKPEREATPIKFAEWLIAVAEKCAIFTTT